MLRRSSSQIADSTMRNESMTLSDDGPKRNKAGKRQRLQDAASLDDARRSSSQ